MAVTNLRSADFLGIQTYEDKKATTGKGRDDLGKQDFLTLFTAQLQNQNPLDPVKNEAFVAQLAQFSQLEALTNMQGSLEKFVASMSAERMLGSANLIGKSVPGVDGAARLNQGGTVSASIELPDGASGVTVQIRDARGLVVQELMAGPQGPGNVDFTWDGLDTNGNPAVPGNYKLTGTAVINGRTQSVPVQTLATVRAVLSDPATGEVSLQIDGGKTIALSQVRRIGQ